MPPPTSSRSTIGSRLSITASLSETFDPPRTTANGRSGSSVSARSTSTSRSTRSPAALGSWWASSSTLACERWTAPNASSTYASPSSASRLAKPSRSLASFEVSAASNRTFSSRTTRGPSGTVDEVGSKPYGFTEELAEPLSHRRQGVLRVGLAAWTAEVGEHDQAGSGGQQVLQGREAGADPAVVGDPRAVERDVEVGAHQDSLAVEVPQRVDPGEPTCHAERRSPTRTVRSASRLE